MKEMRVAVATVRDKGLEDVVSPHFGHTKSFTIIEIEDGKVKTFEVISNPAEALTHKRGLTIAKTLANKNVDAVILSEMGPGASAALQQFGIKTLIVRPGQKVKDALRELGLIT